VFETRITKMFGIKYPILLGGLYWLGRAELVAAVANAGGLGFITAATFDTPENVRAEIRKARDLTDKPIGLNVNLFPSLRPQPVEEWVRVAVEEKVPVVESSGRSPEAIVAPLHAGGVKIMHKVAGVRFARTTERLGCDAVCVVGYECGGHPGLDNVTTLVMVPLAVDAVQIPVVAGGGFADGRGLVAALALGAEAVLMGTRFMATKECRGHPAWKQYLLNASETDTVLALSTLGFPARLIKNAVSQKILELEDRHAPQDEILRAVGGIRGDVYDTGNLDAGMADAGQTMGLIRDIPTVKEFIDRTMEEAVQVRERLNGIIPGRVTA
jgi:NAD(P)H-dependent flavin oxidoreductase YrpB (nitropropane dioxygenase family)